MCTCVAPARRHDLLWRRRSCPLLGKCVIVLCFLSDEDLVNSDSDPEDEEMNAVPGALARHSRPPPPLPPLQPIRRETGGKSFCIVVATAFRHASRFFAQYVVVSLCL